MTTAKVMYVATIRFPNGTTTTLRFDHPPRLGERYFVGNYYAIGEVIAVVEQ